MILTDIEENNIQLDVELCRAMFEKDPDKMIELVSEWLEANRLMTSERFCVPEYLDEILSRARGYSGGRTWHTLAS
ncbi:hypothetical protein [Roseibium salinum]|uniref:Uncharacterized protein n=2 Tax=Roseibium salinum TaxID=1604349 RepID=A0ABT3R6F7_9HYPH|nr:hypothetical protein [Roseibium sp. DSM 29163]MCX2724742.1 hypothetical protein [Roseibium sp. DSM 29163]